MRARVEITGLSQDQWRTVQELPSDFKIQPGTARVCATFETYRQDQGVRLERHLEMPAGALSATLNRLELMERTASAALTPDDDNGARCKCGFRAPELGPHPACPLHGRAQVCDHGATVAEETPSVFDGAPPVRTYADGCQSYGPYAGEESE